MRNRGSQLNQLSVAETVAEFLEQLVADIGRRAGHRNSKIENKLFKLAERITFIILSKLSQLLVSDAEFPAHGSMRVNSCGTSDKGCGLDLGQLSDSAFDMIRPIEQHLEYPPGPEQAWDVRRNFPHVRNTANLAPHGPIKQSRECTRPSIRNTGNSRH
jgi:hypothetical protein